MRTFSLPELLEMFFLRATAMAAMAFVLVAASDAHGQTAPVVSNVWATQRGDVSGDWDGAIAPQAPTAGACPSPNGAAIIITVDGLSFLDTLLPIYDAFQAPYLKAAVEAMQLPLPNDHIINFPWSRDADKDTAEAVSDLQTFLRYYHACARDAEQKFILVSHSWGTVLSFVALAREAQSDPPVYAELFVTLGSPLGAGFGPIPCLPPDLVIQTAIIEYTFVWLLRLSCTSTACFPSTAEWVNYWAWGDMISGPVSSLDSPPGTAHPIA